MTAPSLHELVNAYHPDTLGTVLSQAGVTTLPKTKQDRVALWVLLLPDRKRIERSLDGLTPRCRKALELLQAVGGELRTVRYESLLTRAGLLEKQSKQKKPADRWASPRPEDAVDPVTFAEVLAALVKHGLIWTHTSLAGSTYKLAFAMPGRFAVILPEVAAQLPPLPKRAEAVRSVPHVLPGSARTCQRDLYLLWSTARETPFQTVASGQLRMSDLKRLSGQLLVQETIAKGSKEGDYRRLFFLRRLAEQLQLLEWRNTSGMLDLAAKHDPAFLHGKPAQRVAKSFEVWRTGVWWNELWATYVQGATRAGGTVVDPALPKIVEARQAVLDEIIRRAKAGDEWIWLDAVSLILSTRNESFLVDRSIAEGQRPTYYGYITGSASPYVYNSLGWTWEAYQQDEDLGWRSVEEVFLRSVVAEGLYWLGLVDLGYVQPASQSGGAAPDKVVALRLTDMGRWLLLDGPKPALPEEAGRVVVQPNFRIFAFDPIADSVLARFDTFAARLNAARAIEYEISRETIYRAMQAGQNVDAIKTWLVDVSGNPIPQNVERSLDEWQAAFERITIRRRVAVLQAATPELLDDLMALPIVKPAILRRLSATLVMVEASQVAAVERALLDSDEVPLHTGQADDALPGSLAVDDAGAIHFTHGQPSLYAHSRLHAIAEETDAGWRVTAASVRRGQGAGLDAQAIVATLRQLTGTEPPAALVARIKAWSRHYGDATIHTVTLVEFQDQATLNELLADPELERYLIPFRPSAGLGLANVDPKHLPTVIALLSERGVATK
jgi:hypothetical protein